MVDGAILPSPSTAIDIQEGAVRQLHDLGARLGEAGLTYDERCLDSSAAEAIVLAAEHVVRAAKLPVLTLASR